MIRVAKLSLSLGLLALALYLLDWTELKTTALALNPWVFALVVGLLVLEFPILGLRWYLLVRHLTPMGFWAIMRNYFTSVFFNIFSPAQVGADIYRFLTLKNNVEKGNHEIVKVLFQERILGLLGYLFFYLICLAILIGQGLLSATERSAVFLVFAAGAVFILTAYAFTPFVLKLLSTLSLVQRSQRLCSFLEHTREAVHFGGGARFSQLLTLTLLAVFNWTLVVMIVAMDIGSDAGFWELGLVSTISEFARMLPISVQGIGVREPSFAFFYAQLGHSAETGFIVGTFSFLALSVSIILAGVIGAFLTPSNIALVQQPKHFYQNSAFMRFLFMGAGGFIVTYGCYLAVWSFTADYRLAFWISLGVGIVFAAITNISFTFVRKLNLAGAAYYAGYYYAYSLVNLLSITILIERYGVFEELAPLLTMTVLTPLNYFLSKKLIQKFTVAPKLSVDAKAGPKKCYDGNRER